MSSPRFYIDRTLEPGATIDLPAETVQHLRARRLRAGETLVLFNGRGGEYTATLTAAERRSARAEILDYRTVDPESPLAVTLLQAVGKGERMDFAVQKAVELGVQRIVPVLTERTVVRLDSERAEKRRRHWWGVAVSACEQCGRTRLPAVEAPCRLADGLAAVPAGTRLALTGTGGRGLRELVTGPGGYALLVGPEGGLNEDELTLAESAGFQAVALGPRTLRTETAGVAALAVLQALAGDLG